MMLDLKGCIFAKYECVKLKSVAPIFQVTVCQYKSAFEMFFVIFSFGKVMTWTLTNPSFLHD